MKKCGSQAASALPSGGLKCASIALGEPSVTGLGITEMQQ